MASLARLAPLGGLAALLVLVLALPSPAAAQRRRRTLDVAFVADGPSARYVALQDLVRGEVETLLAGRVRFAEPRVGDYTEAGVQRVLDEALADDDVDVVIALGAISTQLVGAREELPKPVILPVVLPPQELPREAGRSGRRNLAYILGALDLERDLRRFQEIGRFERVDVLLERNTAAVVSGLPAYVSEAGTAAGVAVRVLPIDPDPEAILAALPEDSHAVYLGPLIQLTDEAFGRLLAALQSRGIATFSPLGPGAVRAGVLASATPAEDWTRRARRAALFLQRLLQSEDPARFPVTFEPREQLVINLTTARRIQVYPSWGLITEAELVGERRREAERSLTLQTALREAVVRNLDLQAADRGVAAGQQDVDRARAALLPSISVSASGALIDEDRAASFGSAGQLSSSWTLSAQQVLFSELAWTGFRAQERSQAATILDRDTRRLDVILEAASAYLNVLRTLTAEEVQRDNLRVTRQNLALAQVRITVGSAGPADLYRWQSAIALAQSDVINASATRNQAEIELNRVLNRPLEESFLLVEADLEDPTSLVGGGGRVLRFFDNPWSFRVFRSFMAEEALRNSPELQAFDERIAAVRRQLDGFERVLYLPTVALSASLTHNFLNVGGANPQDQIALPPELEALSAALNTVDAFDFQIGLSVTLPLYSGGERYANIRQAEAQLAQLQDQREATALLVEQRIRSQLHATGARYAAVGLSRQASDASQRNLELVGRSYAEGATTIITLLDAQNQALAARLQAANAVYDFLLQLFEAERAAGRFRIFAEESEREEFVRRLMAFAEERDVRLPARPAPRPDRDENDDEPAQAGEGE